MMLSGLVGVANHLVTTMLYDRAMLSKAPARFTVATFANAAPMVILTERLDNSVNISPEIPFVFVNTPRRETSKGAPLSVIRSLFAEALSEGVDLAEAGEITAPDIEIFDAATTKVSAVMSAVSVPEPTILPLDKGGVSVEWHHAGFNIEIRFRRPGSTYLVIEDAMDTACWFRGQDTELARLPSALAQMASRLHQQ